MLVLNALLDHLNGLYGAAVLLDPTCALYSLLAGTYGGAAVAAARNDHGGLCRCYVLSAVLHGLISVVHAAGM
ncbi:MAG: hypothetical protein JSR72_15890 [Proteobacteria bacterium]|nr:hypothetical protein [Pseudomonadota bacterium]